MVSFFFRCFWSLPAFFPFPPLGFAVPQSHLSASSQFLLSRLLLLSVPVMAKRKAKKKSSPSSSRPSPPSSVHPLVSGPSSPTKKQARHSSLPPQSHLLDLVLPSMKLTGPNWLPELCSVPISPVLVAEGAAPSLTAAGVGLSLAAVGASPSLAAKDSAHSLPVGCAAPPLVVAGSTTIGVDQSPPFVPSQQSSPQSQGFSDSPTFSSLFCPVEVPSPLDSENSYCSDSSSLCGSPALVNSEINARPPTLDSSSPAVAECPSVSPAAPPSDSSLHLVSPALINSDHNARLPSPISSAHAKAESPLLVPVASPSGTKSAPLGPWKNLFASNRSPSSSAQLIHFSELTDSAKCDILNDDLDCACDVWKSCLIGYVSGRFLGFRALKSMIVNTWHCEAVLDA